MTGWCGQNLSSTVKFDSDDPKVIITEFPQISLKHNSCHNERDVDIGKTMTLTESMTKSISANIF